MSTYNIYCDESCHLENDHQKVMVLGAVWCLADKTRLINARIREIQVRHGLSRNFEIKWTKVSPAKIDFYIDLIDYFFDNDFLHFRALIVPDKSKLQHEYYNQDHDTWYYKMYFDMLKVILSPEDCQRIYLDIKDSKGALKVKKLQDVLRNSVYDFHRNIIERVQVIRSHEVEISQLADVLIGAVAYVNRGLSGSAAKQGIIDRIRKRSGYDLTKTTLLMERKFNLFKWHASEVGI